METTINNEKIELESIESNSWINFNLKNSFQLPITTIKNELDVSWITQGLNGQIKGFSSRKNAAYHFYLKGYEFKIPVKSIMIQFGNGQVTLSKSDGSASKNLQYYIWDSIPIFGNWNKPTNQVYWEGVIRLNGQSNYSWNKGYYATELINPSQRIFIGIALYDPWGDTEINFELEYLKFKCSENPF